MLTRIIMDTLVILILARTLPGFRVRTRGTAAVLAISYGLIMGAGLEILFQLSCVMHGLTCALLPILAILGLIALFLFWTISPFALSIVSLSVLAELMKDFGVDSTRTLVIASTVVTLTEITLLGLFYL